MGGGGRGGGSGGARSPRLDCVVYRAPLVIPQW